MATLEEEFVNGMELEDAQKDMVEEEEDEHDSSEDSEEKEHKILLGEILLTYHNHTVWCLLDTGAACQGCWTQCLAGHCGPQEVGGTF